MGDVSSEPSMEDILSSIKRIIAEENDGGAASRGARRPARRAREIDEDEVLELSQPAPFAEPVHDEAEIDEPEVQRVAKPVEPARTRPAPAPAASSEAILSERAYAATRGSIEALSRLVVKPEVAGSDTLEGMVREMLRPMLREWLDSNLPEIVERMVSREIQRISARE